MYIHYITNEEYNLSKKGLYRGLDALEARSAELVAAPPDLLQIDLLLAAQLVGRCIVTKAVEILCRLRIVIFDRLLRFARCAEVELLLRTALEIYFLRSRLDALEEQHRPTDEKYSDDRDSDAAGYHLPLVFGSFL